MVEENMNITVTFPSGVPSGTRLGYKRATSPSSPYTYISQSQVIDVTIATDTNFILELPSGYTFKKWVMTGGSYRGEYTELTNPTVYRFSTGPATVTFEIEQSPVPRSVGFAVSPSDSSQITVECEGVTDTVESSKSITHNRGANAVLTVLPKSGYKFSKWVFRGRQSVTEKTNNPFNGIWDDWGISDDIIQIQGVCEKDESYTPVTLTQDDGATVEYRIGTGAYQDISVGTTINVPSGSSITFRPRVLPSGKVFNYWVKSGSIVEPRESTLIFSPTGTANIQIQLHLKNSTSTHTVNLNFSASAQGNSRIHYMVDSGSMRTITVNTTITVEHNSKISLGVSYLTTGYYFNKWHITKGSTSRDDYTQNLTETITADTTIELYLKRKYKIEVQQTTGGVISPETQEYDEHTDAHFIITPNLHYKITALIVDGTTISPATTYDFTDITQNHTIKATFSEKNKCSVIASAGAGGSISPSGTSYIYEDESEVYTIKPDSGYLIDDVKVDNVSQGKIESIRLYYTSTGHTISATFVRDKVKYQIKVQSTGHGTIVASKTEVYEGESVTITCTPDTDYFLKDLVDNGKSVGTVNPYTINNVKENHTVVATFDRTPYIRTVMYEKVNGAWQIINLELFPKMYVKLNGTWTQLFTEFDAPAMYEKVDGQWVKLYKEVNNRLL